MKIIMIAGCSTCPYGTQWDLEGTEFICSKLTKANMTPEKPLENCPLDDAAKKIKEILNRGFGHGE